MSCGGQVVDGLQGGRDTILIRFLLHRLASPPPPLLLRYLHIDQLLSMQERERRTSDAFEQLPPGLIGEKRKWMLSEKDCRQLSSAAQQGQDTSTRGVKGTQETPTRHQPTLYYTYFLSHPSSTWQPAQPTIALSHPRTLRLKLLFVYRNSRMSPTPPGVGIGKQRRGGVGASNTDKPNQTNLGGFRNAWQDDKQLQLIPHRNDKADQNWN